MLPATSPAAPHASRRRYDLDWLRVIAFALLIFYHVGMFYVTWDWHVKSPHASPLIEPAMALVNPWRLALLFFISGVALRFAMDKSSLRAFLPGRMLRLFVPIVFGMLVVVMPQAYFELRFKGEIGPEFWPFYWRYAALPHQDFSIIIPTWNHLWYVVYILFYTLVVAALLPILRWIIDGPGARFLSWIEEGNGWRLLLVPAVPFLIYRLTLDPRFPTTHALVDDWATHAHSFTILLVGFVVAKSDAFWRAVEKGLRPALAATAITGAILLGARLNWNLVRADEILMPAAQIVRVFYAWFVILVLLGVAQRHLNRSSSALTYLTKAIFPYYILHQTLIVAIGYSLLTSGLPAWAEATVVTGGTVLGCVIGYETIRRVAVLRPLFGLPFREAKTNSREQLLPRPKASAQAVT